MSLLKKTGALLLVLLLLLLILVGGAHLYGSSRLAKAPTVPGKSITVPTDAAAIERGEHLAVALSGCNGCHAPNFGGTPFVNEAPIGYVPAPNLTTGEGGIGTTFTDEQWELAIRHGIGGDGRTLVAMPSTAYAHLSDSDLGALIAYLRQAPAVDHDLGPRRIQFPGSVILGLMAYPTTAVNTIDHATVGTMPSAPEATEVYGEYLSQIGGCRDCHGANLAGGTDSSVPIGPNLTASSSVSSWTEAQFMTALRTGELPSGRVMSSAMPWAEHYRFMTDDELTALYLYLQRLTPLETNPAP